MTDIKQMPYREKYEKVLGFNELIATMVPTFVRDQLGGESAAELKEIWQKGIQPIREDVSWEKKYEIVYNNWIWMVKNNFSFIQEKMGEEGLAQFQRAEVKALKRENAELALILLNLIRAVSPGTAFRMTAKEFAYQLQWITPFSVSRLDRNKAVFDIPQCKILDFPDTEAICFAGCQKVYPRWVAEQFKAKMEFSRQEKSCTCTLTPLN
jgi:hypothetical protein